MEEVSRGTDNGPDRMDYELEEQPVQQEATTSNPTLPSETEEGQPPVTEHASIQEKSIELDSTGYLEQKDGTLGQQQGKDPSPSEEDRQESHSRPETKSSSYHSRQASKHRATLHGTIRRPEERSSTNIISAGLSAVGTALGISGSTDEDKQLRKLEKERRDLVSENSALKREINDLNAKIDESENRARLQHELARSHMDTATRQKKEIEALQEKLQQMGKEQQGLEDQIGIAQLAMSKKYTRPKIGLAEEERTIQGNFLSLHDEVRKWAKMWSITDFSLVNSLDAETRKSLLNVLQKVIALDAGDIPSALKTANMSTRSSVLCVSAVLGHYICQYTIEAPFRPLRPLVTIKSDDSGKEKDKESVNEHVLGEILLEDLYRKLSDANKAKAQIWRSDLLTILDPPQFDGASQATLHAQREAFERRMQAAHDLTVEFLDSAIFALLRPLEPEDTVTRDEQLCAIFQRALDMAGRLWKQLTIVKCSYLGDLQHDQFRYESELMEAHAFHKLGLDDESEDRLDNHPIRILVFPAVKSYGNSDGKDYSQHRIWGKAIVWLKE